MKLLLDLGNSRLKWALAEPGGTVWLAHGAVGWDEDLAAMLASAWEPLPTPSVIVAASVVDPDREARVAKIVAIHFAGITPVWLRTPASACGVRNAYAEPERLGVDRFLAMVAAHATAAVPCVLASVGTALTLDALAADGQHLGGLIAPGPQLMQHSLLAATAQVRPAQPGQILDVADNTADAVASGCWHAAAALIERFVTRMEPRLGMAPQLVLSGGDAARLMPLLSLPARLEGQVVLRGLAVWAEAQRER